MTGDPPARLHDVVADDQRMREFTQLTPMQQLVMECLASRYRLGHEVWTFTMNQALPKVLTSLRQQGYLETMGGVVQGTVRALLTQKGKDLVLDPAYVPPILGGHDDLKEKHDPHAT